MEDEIEKDSSDASCTPGSENDITVGGGDSTCSTSSEDQSLTTPKSVRGRGRPTTKSKDRGGGRPSISIITEIFMDTTIQTPSISRKRRTFSKNSSTLETDPYEPENYRFDMVETVGNSSFHFPISLN